MLQWGILHCANFAPPKFGQLNKAYIIFRFLVPSATFCRLWEHDPPIPTELYMGYAARGGLAHEIKARGARHRSTCAARLREASLMTNEDLIGYARYHIPCKHISCNRS